ncbi:MAG: tetratricopeptide repeat protein [Candidatus Sericytochromatia bacterium]
MDLEALRAAAMGGDAMAQAALAWRLMRGEGLAKDPEQAVWWMGRAAEQGDAEAQYQVGAWLCLLDRACEAVGWWDRAAAQGHRLAQRSLGHAYLHGHGVEACPATARRWYAEAAGQGCEASRAAMSELSGHLPEPD